VAAVAAVARAVAAMARVVAVPGGHSRPFLSVAHPNIPP
jgi:hypothetical protein